MISNLAAATLTKARQMLVKDTRYGPRKPRRPIAQGRQIQQSEPRSAVELMARRILAGSKRRSTMGE